MSTLGSSKSQLGGRERTAGFVVGLCAIIFATYLVVSPPMRRSELQSAAEKPQITISPSDQSSVVIALYTAGAAFMFFALNGLRLTKFAAGPISGESEGDQGTTAPLPPSAAAPNVAPESPLLDRATVFKALAPEEKKILRTLWRYQLSNFQRDFTTRWTFKVFPNVPEHPTFLRGVASLAEKSLVAVTRETDQCALTNEGILLMSSIGDEATKGEFYVF